MPRGTTTDHASILMPMDTREKIDVKRVAALARVELTPEEIELFSRQLNDILAYAEAVQQIDTTGVPPTSHAGTTEPVWRDDVPQTPLDRTTVLEQAPGAAVAAGLFKVPKVL